MGETEQKFIHDKECVSCRKLFECKGKSESIDKCLWFEEKYRINKAEEKIRLLLETSLNVIESIANLNSLSEKKGDENNE